MRELIFGAILVGAAGAGAWFIPLGAGERPDYALSVSEAKQLLAKADLRKGKAPFGTLDVLVTAPQQNVVRYEASGTFAALDCRAELTGVEGGVDVATSCSRGAASDGAAAPAAKDLTELGFAEYVASVLGKRPFNENKLAAQSAASVLKNMPQMQRDALKMERDIRQMTQESDDQQSGGEVEWSSGEEGAADYAPDSEY